MTHTRNAVEIGASPERIYALAAATERWPEILPHYRWVRVLSERGATRLVEMAARRGWIPVRWTAEQRNDPTVPAIRFRHVRGWTRGMEVEWRFEPRGPRTLVTIEHHLEFAFPIGAQFLGDRVVGAFFVEHIAGRTLARIKALAETPA